MEINIKIMIRINANIMIRLKIRVKIQITINTTLKWVGWACGSEVSEAPTPSAVSTFTFLLLVGVTSYESDISTTKQTEPTNEGRLSHYYNYSPSSLLQGGAVLTRRAD